MYEEGYSTLKMSLYYYKKANWAFSFVKEFRVYV